MNFDRVLAFAAGLVFGATAIHAIKTGRTRFGRRGKLLGPWTFHRESRPTEFWLAVSFYVFMAVLLAVIAFYGLADGS